MSHFHHYLDGHKDGRFRLSPRRLDYVDPASVAGFAMTCIFIIVFIALLIGTIFVSFNLHSRRQRNDMQRRGGRLGLVLVAGELFALVMLIPNAVGYGWAAVGYNSIVRTLHVEGERE